MEGCKQFSVFPIDSDEEKIFVLGAQRAFGGIALDLQMPIFPVASQRRPLRVRISDTRCEIRNSSSFQAGTHLRELVSLTQGW
jgi:hypothetical protein